MNLTYEHELGKSKTWPNNKTLIVSTNHAYLIDHDPVENHLYFAECIMPIRPIIMSCSKTRGIYRIDLKKNNGEREVRDEKMLVSLLIDDGFFFHS